MVYFVHVIILHNFMANTATGNLFDNPSQSSNDNLPEWMRELPPVEEYSFDPDTTPPEAGNAASSSISDPSEAGNYDPYYGEWEQTATVDGDNEPDRREPLDKNQVTQGMNDRQTRAISMPVTGAAMVLAGAGTGKTAVLTRRIAWLVANGVAPRSIMAVTFTNKAAREMKDRLTKLGVSPLPMMGTFHSVGLRILKLCPESAGVSKGFTVMDESDTKSLWARLFTVRPVPKGRSFDPLKDQVPDPLKHQIYSTDPNLAIFRAWMFSLKELGIRSSDDNLANFEINKNIPQSIYYMLDIYEKERRALNMVDFSDLISGSLAAINDTDKGMDWAQGFSHLLVDEFQDTSALQFMWVRQMMAGRGNIFCVGDDSQSIYSFRGAVVKNIELFVKEFNATEVLLEQNYRCGTDILDSANKLIAKNQGGSRKKLWADGGSGNVEYREFFNEIDEARWIARQIHLAGNVDNTAILSRTRAAMIPIASALRDAGVVHHVVGAKDFFDRREIKDAMSMVRMACNPSDYLAFVRVASIFKGVGEVAIDRVITASHARHQSPAVACCSDKSDSVRAIGNVFDGVSRKSNSSDAVWHLIEYSGFRKQCEEDADAARIRNIKDFMQMSEKFSTLGHFLEEMTLSAERSGLQEGVAVSTIHAAKGLEWDDVYLPALSQGHLPSEQQSDDPVEILSDLEEDRRLMYVALTRAKSGLFTSVAKDRLVFGKTVSSRPSIFIEEAGLRDHHKRRDSFSDRVRACQTEKLAALPSTRPRP